MGDRNFSLARAVLVCWNRPAGTYGTVYAYMYTPAVDTRRRGDGRACTRAHARGRRSGDSSRGAMLGSAAMRCGLLGFCGALLLLLLHDAHAMCRVTTSLGCFVDNDGPRVLNGYYILPALMTMQICYSLIDDTYALVGAGTHNLGRTATAWTSITAASCVRTKVSPSLEWRTATSVSGMLVLPISCPPLPEYFASVAVASLESCT